MPDEDEQQYVTQIMPLLSLLVVYLCLVMNSVTQQITYTVKKQLGDFACIFISMKSDEEGDGAFGEGIFSQWEESMKSGEPE